MRSKMIRNSTCLSWVGALRLSRVDASCPFGAVTQSASSSALWQYGSQSDSSGMPRLSKHKSAPYPSAKDLSGVLSRHRDRSCGALGCSTAGN
jgi:hypothetical protein